MAYVRLHSLINEKLMNRTHLIFISRGKDIRDDLWCPFSLELVCLCGYSSMKHLRPIADVGHELEWHHTLKQTIKCTLEKSEGMKMMQGRTFFS